VKRLLNSFNSSTFLVTFCLINMGVISEISIRCVWLLLDHKFLKFPFDGLLPLIDERVVLKFIDRQNVGGHVYIWPVSHIIGSNGSDNLICSVVLSLIKAIELRSLQLVRLNNRRDRSMRWFSTSCIVSDTRPLFTAFTDGDQLLTFGPSSHIE
jgi:hypothetical protein